MSRRTKLIILALFLVLLAIPATYIVLTWHPENPLRFRLMYVHPDATFGDDARLVRVRMENTSIAPIQLEHVLIDPNPKYVMGGGGLILSYIQTDGRRSDYLNEFIIPPSGTAELNAILIGDRFDEARQGNLTVKYHWRSQLLRKEHDLRDWIHEHVPIFRKDPLRYMPPYDADVAPLENAMP